MTLSEGGLVTPVNDSLGYSRWLCSLSLTSSLPGKASRIPVKPFVNLLLNDHGSGTNNKSPIFFEAGLKTGIWNFFEIYFPLLFLKILMLLPDHSKTEFGLFSGWINLISSHLNNSNLQVHGTGLPIFTFKGMYDG